MGCVGGDGSRVLSMIPQEKSYIPCLRTDSAVAVAAGRRRGLVHCVFVRAGQRVFVKMQAESECLRALHSVQLENGQRAGASCTVYAPRPEKCTHQVSRDDAHLMADDKAHETGRDDAHGDSETIRQGVAVH